MNIDVINDNIIGDSKIILDLKRKVKELSKYTATLLISGETGTGKELVARGLHYGGILAGKPFIAVNCSTFSDDLFTSELFGYKRGAFTDAKNDKEGILSSVNGGTIFLDEIDSLSLKSQASLLRVLQELEFRPIGSTQVLKTNARFIAATNSNLQEKIDQGKFRQDLYFRLFILSINVPPLRDRQEDIPTLCNHFLDKLNTQYGLNKDSISPSLMSYLINKKWPGNVRELENCLHRYYLLSPGNTVDLQEYDSHKISVKESDESIREIISSEDISIPLDFDNENKEYINFSDAKRIAIESFEAKFVSRLLYMCQGNITKAAKLCGKERRAFGKMVKKYNIKNNEIKVY